MLINTTNRGESRLLKGGGGGGGGTARCVIIVDVGLSGICTLKVCKAHVQAC